MLETRKEKCTCMSEKTRALMRLLMLTGSRGRAAMADWMRFKRNNRSRERFHTFQDTILPA